jgi:cytochrome c oxidase subunit 1
MPRRVHAYAPEFQVYNVLSTAGASILGAAYLIPFIYFIWSLRWGKKAGDNPWHATGLEWTTTSPPPKHNFHEVPIVTQDPYEYAPLDEFGEPLTAEDRTMQNAPLTDR